MKLLGFIVNPVAGMGGSVGLKGTDGEIIKDAIKLGAKPVVPKRVEVFSSHIESKDQFCLLVAPGKMGEELLNGKGFKFKVVGHIQQQTTAEDTKRIANLMLKEQVELLIFCGGDGTARDIFDAIGLKIKYQWLQFHPE